MGSSSPVHDVLSLVLLFALPVYFVVKLLLLARRPKDFPPGPPTLPVVGNLHQIPSHEPHKRFQSWAQKYGPIYGLILGSKPYIVLSSDVAVKQLLDKRSAIYSDRPDLYVQGDLLSGGLRVLQMRYGPQWREVRKMIHGFANIAAAKEYETYQVLENKQMLNDMLDRPGNFLNHFQRYTNSLTTSIVYGWRTPSYHDPVLQKFYKITVDRIRAGATVNSSALDYYPLLRSLPSIFLPTQRRAKAIHAREKELLLSHWLSAKKDINNIKTANPRPCMCRDITREQQLRGFSDDLAAYIAGAVLGAGSDTTANTLYGFAQAMVVFPDVQKKAQLVIDAAVGNRLPTMADECDPRMQYIRSCVKESLRWMPTAFLGAAPHANTKDDEYMGYRIPAGTGVILNTYTIHMDPSRYPDPRRFDPDRYIDDKMSAYDSANTADVAHRDHFSFGAGRRICPGMHIAERSLFLGISRMLWTFDFKPALDARGNEVIPNTELLEDGMATRPVAFNARITPRSEERKETVRREWTEVKNGFLNEKG